MKRNKNSHISPLVNLNTRNKKKKNISESDIKSPSYESLP